MPTTVLASITLLTAIVVLTSRRIERRALAISVMEGVLHATRTGCRRPFTRREFVRAQLAVPLMPQRVTALISLKALRRYHKGVPVFRKPPFRTGEGTIAPTAPVPARRGPHCRVAEDSALSRRQHGFESRWGHCTPSPSDTHRAK